ncbi:MAG: hypothetical protein L6420_07980 [Elusimicrobia bacterium]|nr:hypothetical protein [Elusimicrobiota bacterium]
MKKVILFFIAFFLFFSGQLSFAADNILPSSEETARQRELQPELIEWMAERYDPKILLGLEWKNMDKAALYRAVNRMQWSPADDKGFFSVRKSGIGKKGGRTGMPSKRLDISPALLQQSLYPDIESATYGIKITAPGNPVGWNAGYSKVSETDNSLSLLGDKYTTKGDIIFASMVFSRPSGNIAPYFYFGPALVKYIYSETTTFSTFNPFGPPWFITTTSSLEKNGSAFTWILGAGASYTVPNSNFGFFAEYKHIPEVDDFWGIDNMVFGVSLSL